MNIPLLRTFVPVIVAIGLLAAGCGGDGSDQTGQTAEQSPPAQQQPGVNPDNPDQSQPPTPQQNPPSPNGLDQANVEEAQIEAAGRVYAKMQQAEQDYLESEGRPQNKQDQQQAQQQMQQELKQYISEEDDINGQQFNMVMQLAQQNRQVGQLFAQAVEDAGGQPPQLQQQPAPNNQQQPPAPNN